jgi:hypothetical protein
VGRRVACVFPHTRYGVSVRDVVAHGGVCGVTGPDYILTITCGACPVQYQGHLHDGRAWYFRARSGGWALRVSVEPMPEIADSVVVEPIFAEGDDPFGGWMPHAVADPLIRALLTLAEGDP